MIKRVRTGISGFDEITQGGFVQNSINLLGGVTGTGKTIFSLQYLINGAKYLNEKGIYISFEEPEEDLRMDIESLGLNFDGLGGKLKIFYIPPYSVTNFLTVLNQELSSFRPQRVVIDSINALILPMEDDFERKKQIFKVREILKVMNCTTIITSGRREEHLSDSNTSLPQFSFDEFCDSVVLLSYVGQHGELGRAIRIVKMRGTSHSKGLTPMEIGKMGITVYKPKPKS